MQKTAKPTAAGARDLRPDWIKDGRLADEEEVIVAGDWHSNTVWAMKVIPRAAQAAPNARTILHLGDFNLDVGFVAKAFMNMVDARCRGNGIERVLITPGNHDHYGRMLSRKAWRVGQPVQMSDFVWVLPRGYRFSIGGRSFLSFGGAASLDRRTRKLRGPHRNWWPDEVARKETFWAVAAGGHADVMLTHEAVNGATPATEGAEGGKNPYGWPDHRLIASGLSRARTTELWDAVRPDVLFHGHMHHRGAGTMPDGRRVYALDCDSRPGNIGVLHLPSLEWSAGL